MLTGSDFIIANCHGVNGCIQLSSNQFAELRCVLLLTCLLAADATVDGKTYNLMDEIFKLGAHFVLGTTISIGTGDANQFLRD